MVLCLRGVLSVFFKSKSRGDGRNRSEMFFDNF
jgi:hypothetical protein